MIQLWVNQSILNLQILDGGHNHILSSLQDFSSHNDLIQDSIYLVEVKHDVQLTHIAKILIQVLHEEMDELYEGDEYFQVQKFIIIDIDADCKIEALVSLIDNFEVVELSGWGSTSMKSVCLESRPTIIRWIYDCSLSFSFSS